MFKKRGAIQWDVLGYWIIGIVLLVIMIGIFVILSGKGSGALEFIKNLLRFGR